MTTAIQSKGERFMEALEIEAIFAPGPDAVEDSNSADSASVCVLESAPQSDRPRAKPPAISNRKLAANRANALKSTGPRTPEGKRRSSANAVVHGVLSFVLPLPDEDTDELDAFEDSLFDRYLPEGPVETLLVERIVSCAWRLRRALDFEAYLAGGGGRALSYNGGVGWEYLGKLGRYEARIERAMYRAMAELRALQEERGR